MFNRKREVIQLFFEMVPTKKIFLIDFDISLVNLILTHIKVFMKIIIAEVN